MPTKVDLASGSSNTVMCDRRPLWGRLIPGSSKEVSEDRLVFGRL